MGETIRFDQALMRQLEDFRLDAARSSQNAAMRSDSKLSARESAAQDPSRGPSTDDSPPQDDESNVSRLIDMAHAVADDKEQEKSPGFSALMESLRNNLSGRNDTSRDDKGAIAALSDEVGKLIDWGKSAKSSGDEGAATSGDADASETEVGSKDSRSNSDGAAQIPVGGDRFPGSPQAQKEEKALSEVNRDPEKYLNDSGGLGSSQLNDGAEVKADGGMPVLIPLGVNAEFNPENNIKAGQMVDRGASIAKIGVHANELVQDSCKKAVLELLKKSVGDFAEIENDGTVKATEKKRIDFIASGVSINDEMPLVGQKDMEKNNSFDEFMQGQGENEYTKAREYVDKNGGASDGEWVRNRLTTMERGIDGSVEQKGIEDEMPHSTDLRDQYRGLWKDDLGSRDFPRPPGA